MRLKTIVAMAVAMAFGVLACKPEEQEAKDPSAPAGVKLHSATETSLTFQWNAVSGVTGYTWKLLEGSADAGSGTVTARNVKITGLTAGTTYRFAVASNWDGGMSDFSDYVEAATVSAEEDPDDPGTDPDPGSDTPVSEETYAEFKIPAAEDEDGAARAFPGAEGGGMYTTGGRGGKVIHVTTLNDSGTGSLRYALSQSGARIIVFDVAGIIELQSDLKISNGNVTIAGQTAPGDGICLKNYTTVINADNVIIRYLRFRLGDEAAWSDAQIASGAADGEDAFWGRYRKNIMLDHCSMSWSIDETASFYANANMTMQWCIVAESMSSCRLHSKGDHGYGGIWGGRNASFHHNLLAHHTNRTPRFDHQYLYDGNGVSTDTYRGNVDYRNCVNYNWGGGNGCYGGEGGHYNLVNNYYKPGPNSADRAYFMEVDGGYSTTVDGTKKYFPYDWAYLYLSGNYHYKYPSGSSKYPDGVYWKKAYSDYSMSYSGHLLSSPLPILGKDDATAYTTTHSAQNAMARVCSYAGASLKRDAVDARIAGDVSAGTGKIITDMDSVKSAYGMKWPDYTATDAEISNNLDTDKDGMPDWFEDRFGLDKTSASDAAAKNLDIKGRYSNLEMYLHYLVRDIVASGNAGGTYTKL